MILYLAYVVDDGLKAFLVVDIELTFHAQPTISGESPRGLRNHVRRVDRRRSCCNALSRRVHQALNCSLDLLGFAVARHDDVHMVRAAIDGVESPPPHPAMIGNGQFS